MPYKLYRINSKAFRNTKVIGDPISTMINIMLRPSPKGNYCNPFYLMSNNFLDLASRLSRNSFRIARKLRKRGAINASRSNIGRRGSRHLRSSGNRGAAAGTVVGVASTEAGTGEATETGAEQTNLVPKVFLRREEVKKCPGNEVENKQRQNQEPWETHQP